MVTQGDCRLNVPGHLQAELSQGDLVIFPRELAHSMDPLQPTDGPHEHLPYADAVHRKGMGLLCGSVTFRHSGSRFLLDALPAVFVIAAKEQSGWISSLLEMIMAESLVPEAGSISILDRLSELLFIYALRQFLRENTEHTGVLALYGHPRLAKAVAALHSNPAHSWSLKELAECAAMSRTSFANNFKKISGWTAMQYLAWWRMQLAWSQLSEGESVTKVSVNIGYQSEAAFSRAFQKCFATSPGKVRRKV